MALWQLLTRLQASQRLTHRARGRVPNLTEPLRQSLSPSVWSMSRAEARGYIRAKATPIILAELQRLTLGQPRLFEARRPDLTADLSERLVHVVLEDVFRVRK